MSCAQRRRRELAALERFPGSRGVNVTCRENSEILRVDSAGRRSAAVRKGRRALNTFSLISRKMRMTRAAGADST